MTFCCSYNHLCGITEGASKWQWHVTTPHGVTRAIPGATGQSFTPLEEHALCRFFFRWEQRSLLFTKVYCLNKVYCFNQVYCLLEHVHLTRVGAGTGRCRVRMTALRGLTSTS